MASRFKCNNCDFKSNSPSSFHAHKSKHSGIVHACPHCDYKSWLKQPLQNHIQAHHRGVSHTCKDCGKVYKYKGDLKTHQRASHEGIVYPCRYCTHKSNRKAELIQHEQFVHIRDNLVTCNICNETFLRNNHLKRHMMKHNPFQCSLCDLSFSYDSALQSHKRCHQEKPGEIITERPYNCMECAKTFKLPSHLKEHKSIHSKERPHPCNICQKSFRLKSFLTAHLKTHNKSRVNCNQCEKTFSDKKCLGRHILNHHLQVRQENIEQHPTPKIEKSKSFIKNSEVIDPPPVESDNETIRRSLTQGHEEADQIFHCSILQCDFVSFGQNILERKDHILNSHSDITYTNRLFVSSSQLFEALEAEITNLI